jgi:hypothetical protein
MAIYSKAVPSEPIRDGAAAVARPGKTSLFQRPEVPSLPNIDSMQTVVNLDNRYKVAPSGWNA